MAIKFNPLTGNFDFTGSGGGGGSSYIDGEEATYNDLSLDAGVAPLNSAWLVRNSSGIWPFNKPGGIYIRTATLGVSRDTDYTYAGTMPDVFSDAVLTIYDEASTTRTGQFNLGSVTAGQNRVLTWPDANGTIARTETFAAPPAIGSATPAAGTFTTLTANTSLTLGTSGILTGGTNLIEQVNGTNGQTFNLYRTTSSANANYERGFIRWGGTSSNTLQIGTEKLGTGSRRTLEFVTDNTARWRVGDGSITATPSMLALGNAAIFGTNEAYNVIIAAGSQGTANAGVFTPNGSNTGYLAIGESLHLGLLNNGSSGDVRLVRDAANVLALRNGANTPQAYRIYNTFTSTTSLERANFRWASNEFIIDAEAGSGGGTLRGIKIGSAATSLLGFYGITPAAQPAAVADATDAASTQDRLNDLLARLRTLGLIAT